MTGCNSFSFHLSQPPPNPTLPIEVYLGNPGLDVLVSTYYWNLSLSFADNVTAFLNQFIADYYTLFGVYPSIVYNGPTYWGTSVTLSFPTLPPHTNLNIIHDNDVLPEFYYAHWTTFVTCPSFSCPPGSLAVDMLITNIQPGAVISPVAFDEVENCDNVTYDTRFIPVGPNTHLAAVSFASMLVNASPVVLGYQILASTDTDLNPLSTAGPTIVRICFDSGVVGCFPLFAICTSASIGPPGVLAEVNLDWQGCGCNCYTPEVLAHFLHIP